MEYESQKASSDVLKRRNIYIYIYIWFIFNNYSENRKHIHFQISPFYSTHKICRSEVNSGVLQRTHLSRHASNIYATRCGFSLA